MRRRVVRFLLLVALVSTLGARSVHVQESSTKAAQASVDAWLALIDGQRYAASWDEAASIFKSAVPQEKWSAAVQAARASLGQMKSRTLNAAPSPIKPPAAPEGEYLLLQFSTTFDQRSAAAETVTVFKEKDGTWRVAGYFIK